MTILADAHILELCTQTFFLLSFIDIQNASKFLLLSSSFFVHLLLQPFPLLLQPLLLLLQSLLFYSLFYLPLFRLLSQPDINV